VTPRPPVSMAALCADLDAETRELRALVAPLPEVRWRLATPAPGWTIADQVVHLADVDGAAVLAATRPDEFAAAMDGPRRSVDERVAEHRDRSGVDVLAWFDAARARLLEVFGALEPRARVPWFGPPMSAASSLTARIMETWAHGQDVADALGATREPSARLRHVAHLGVLARAYSLRDDPAARTDVRVELAAPDGGTWTWGEPDSPDRVRAPAPDFCLLVTRRRHPDDLALEVTGPVARRWVAVAQAYAGPPGPGREPGGRTPRSSSPGGGTAR
jgi:uncharacterized protein (TIGR03084 family)